ncbi:glycoside hydrolase family 3 protein [Lipingzhangella sp. LS1_29]|uniref:Glycoside hydrolase family 3 protein n=1 Tax=Lipingzhangella rawalii TaxID=2055835 RepID=A0ABU2H8Q4_9ACTN|nr:glycoside hydrolase family 3 protein [Lipingzhangella rawalii]MDS1271687.1 glycoside hydrolase family 3 protein [Lipingzhangella rawalii]
MSQDATLDRLANATLLVPFPGTEAPRWLLDGLAEGFAGVCLFHNNIASPEQVSSLVSHLNRAAEAPIVSLDEEGGDVTRIGHLQGSAYPGNAALGVVDDLELTRRVHHALATELADLGVTLDLAPSVDVNVAEDNPVIGTRSFGSDTDLVARHAAAAVSGLQSAGVAACAKHFPGHGATHQDSHEVLPVVDAAPDLLHSRELQPFRTAIDAGVASILTAHIQLPSLGLTGPATLSRAVVTDLLRKQLGFTGVVISDALEMRGVSADIGVPEAAVRALESGCDLLCLGRYIYDTDIATVREAITTAVRSGRLPGERLEEAASRVATLRSPTPTVTPPTHERASGLDGARRALTVEGDLPDLNHPEGPVVVELDVPPMAAVGEVPWGLGPWFPETRRLRPEHTTVDEVRAAVGDRPLVLVVRDAHRHEDTRNLVTEVCQAYPDTVVVDMGVPVWRPQCRAYIRTYGAARVNAQGAAEVLRTRVAAPVH